MKIALKLRPADIAVFNQSLELSAQRVINAADAGLDAASSRAFAFAQAKTPRVTGALASSGKLASDNVGLLLRRTISYGDATTNPKTNVATSKYAPMVHEVFNPDHPNSYKWLEYSIREYGKEQFLNDLAASIKSAL